MTIVMNMESSMNSLPLIPRNKMVLYKGRTRPSSLLLDQCLMNMERLKDFRLKQSTPHAMLQIDSIYTACSRRPLVSYWLEGSQMCHISGCLVVSATSTRRDNILANSKEGVILASWLDTPQASSHIGSTMNPPDCRRTYDVEFDESNERYGGIDGNEDEEKQRRAMKKIPKGEIKPKEDEEEIVDQIGPSSTLEEDEDKPLTTQDAQGKELSSQAQDQAQEQEFPPQEQVSPSRIT